MLDLFGTGDGCTVSLHSTYLRFRILFRTLTCVYRPMPQGDWPKKPVVSSYDVVEQGGFVWLFYGSRSVPEDVRPPIPMMPEVRRRLHAAAFLMPGLTTIRQGLHLHCEHLCRLSNITLTLSLLGVAHQISTAAQLEDPAWKPVYGEIEFECGHWGVFENAIDMAHIHYPARRLFRQQGAFSVLSEIMWTSMSHRDPVSSPFVLCFMVNALFHG